MESYAVIGASLNKEKWGYKVYKHLLFLGFKVIPINPKITKIEGKKCYPNIASIPQKPDTVICVVPPKITEQIVKECIKLKIKTVWMQPGSESEKAIENCKNAGIKLIHHACIIESGPKKSD